MYCSTSGFGQTGPRSQWAGHDLNYLGVGGFLHCTGRGADGQPPVPGLTLADSAGGGMHAVMAILAALVRRATTGEGAFLDVSIADGVLGLMALAVDEYLATGDEPAPRHGLLTGRYACYDTYPTRDGRWLTVAAIEPRFWANLCERVGLPQWAAHQEDDAVQDQIRAELRAVFLTRDLDDWIAELSPADTCVAPVLTVPEIVDRRAVPRARRLRRRARCDRRRLPAGRPGVRGHDPIDRTVRGARHDRDRHRRAPARRRARRRRSWRSCTRAG